MSHNEREAISRFLAKVIADVDKVSALFESRGVDASRTRVAQANLEATLAELSSGQSVNADRRVFTADTLS